MKVVIEPLARKEASQDCITLTSLKRSLTKIINLVYSLARAKRSYNEHNVVNYSAALFKLRAVSTTTAHVYRCGPPG